jgi:hypothetical protein
MSRTKAFLFDRLPQDDARKAELTAEFKQHAAAFAFRVPTRRKNPLGRPRWDPLWPACLRKAAKELGVETIQINDGLHLRSIEDRELVVERAEALLKEGPSSIFKRTYP